MFALRALVLVGACSGFAHAQTAAGIAAYIKQGLNPSPTPTTLSTAVSAAARPNVVTFDSSNLYTVVTTYYAPGSTSVVAVLNDGMMALLGDGHSITLAGQQLVASPGGVVVLGTGAEAVSVTAAA